MDYCKVCSDCGARLDPGEVCDCQKNELKIYLEEGTNDG